MAHSSAGPVRPPYIPFLIGFFLLTLILGFLYHPDANESRPKKESQAEEPLKWESKLYYSWQLLLGHGHPHDPADIPFQIARFAGIAFLSLAGFIAFLEICQKQIKQFSLAARANTWWFRDQFPISRFELR